MKLDRNINKDGRGKYALINLRETSMTLGELNQVFIDHVQNGAMAIDFGVAADTEFFVIRLKDKYAAAALGAYAMAAFEDDPEYALEVMNLAKTAAEHPRKRMPD